MLACDWVSPMLGTAHNLLKANGADGSEWDNQPLSLSAALCSGAQLLCSVKGSESLFDVEVNRLSVKRGQDRSGSVLSGETQMKSHWDVGRVESGAIEVVKVRLNRTNGVSKSAHLH